MAVPSDIASLKAWWDFSDTVTLADVSAGPIDDTDEVGTVVDKGGALDLTGTTGATPTWIANGQNSLGVARFDGVDNRLSLASVTLSDLISADEGTIFLAFKPHADTTPNIILDHGSGTGNEFTLYLPYSDDVIYLDWGNVFSGGRVSEAGNGGIRGAWHVVVIRRKTDNSIIVRLDGTEIFAGTYSDAIDTTAVETLWLGASHSPEYFKGDIGEVYVASAGLSDGDVAAQETYLGTKWGITIAGGATSHKNLLLLGVG